MYNTYNIICTNVVYTKYIRTYIRICGTYNMDMYVQHYLLYCMYCVYCMYQYCVYCVYCVYCAYCVYHVYCMYCLLMFIPCFSLNASSSVCTHTCVLYPLVLGASSVMCTSKSKNPSRDSACSLQPVVGPTAG